MFPVAYGGLMVAIEGRWILGGPREEAAGAGGRPGGCPSREYYVALNMEKLVFDRPISGTPIPASASDGRVVLTWRGLDDGDYYLRITTSHDDSGCCFDGSITVDTSPCLAGNPGSMSPTSHETGPGWSALKGPGKPFPIHIQPDTNIPDVKTRPALVGEVGDRRPDLRVIQAQGDVLRPH